MATPERLRLTPHRRAVLDVLLAAADHPTAAEVFRRVRAQQPGIGPATVYRALGRLVAAGQARELVLDGSPTVRYDGNTGRHDHVVCRSCGHAQDVTVGLTPDVAAAVGAQTGYLVTSYDLVFHGLCPHCQDIHPPIPR